MAGTGKAHLRSTSDVLLRVEDLVVEFPIDRHSVVHAVSGISFDVVKGETLGLVGESGCGKSTTAKAIIQIPRPTSGTVEFQGTELHSLNDAELRDIRSQIQMIFQDPIASLNPRRTVRRIVSEGLVVSNTTVSRPGWALLGLAVVLAVITVFTSPLVLFVALVAGLAGGFTILKGVFRPNIGDSSFERVDEIIKAVGLDPVEAAKRRPHEYSGGQCQRVSVARTLVLDPQIVICDEPVSALDVSVQAQILNMLEDMKERYGLTLVFISHDLSVVRNVSDRLAVMYLGKMCEIGDGDLVYAKPAHPYTQVLLAALPDPTNLHAGVVDALNFELPSPINPPSGCRFRTRCPRAEAICAEQEPQITQVGTGDQWVACHFPLTDGS
ncbi:MAG: ATP-binding cassette domain-containing protein [Acidimicrobiales bacterium]|jgi:peptide/nickel transport system ATP-binding protein